MNASVPEVEKFAKVASPKPTGGTFDVRGEIPGEQAAKGDVVNVSVTLTDVSPQRSIRLTRKLAQGGEGSVFATDVKGCVAKIFQRDKLTEDRYAKLCAMLSKPIRANGICFPVGLIYNSAGEWVGYLMPEAKGVELGRSVFVPQLLMQKFPDWTRMDTIEMCLTILQKIKYLNDRRVIIGDINPANILVVSPKEVYFVDCDSYQVDGYSCPVGTAHYTPPEVAGRDFKTFLRTQEMENFAIATLLFMIMLPGKAPYSAVGGASPAQNIKAGNFPYEGDGDALPPGKWGFIWSHMAFRARRAFFESFKKGEPHFAPGKRYSADDWIGHFKAYLSSSKHMLGNDPMAMDIFPTRVKMKECRSDGCDRRFVPTEANLYLFCDQHVKRSPQSNLLTRGSRTTSSTRQAGSQATSTTKTKVECANPQCARTRPVTRGDYCEGCWTQVGCKNCGYVAAKWMHDERGGLCKRCHPTQQQQSRPKSSASNSKLTTSGASSGKNSNSGCFVATAVYGSYDCPEVWVLRRWRDATLLRTRSGRAVVRSYYATSPVLVRVVGSKWWFTSPARRALDMLVRSLMRSGLSDDPYRDVGEEQPMPLTSTTTDGENQWPH